MKKETIRMYIAGLIAMTVIASSVGCSQAASTTSSSSTGASASASIVTVADGEQATVTQVSNSSAGTLKASEQFTERDLTQTADLSQAVECTLSSGNDIVISKAGVYHITGSATEASIIVEAGSEDKVQIVLDGVSITNSDFPCIYVRSADKVFVTLSGKNSLTVSGSFRADGDTNTDGVIFSKDDLTLNGTGSLTVNSTDNGIVGKDDLKITGGTYVINATSKAIEANDSIRISGGSFTIKAGTDGLHAENEDDDTLGYVYISGGSFAISADDDGIHATSIAQIDGGTFTVNAAEGVEATYIQINDGTISISSWDDGINAARKSSAYTPTVEINGGDITIVMGSGDTDGVDSNGNIIINGGTINVTGNSTFDYDGTAQYNGGTIICNGQQVTTIPNQMMGGGGRGGNFGGNGGNFGGGRGRRG